MPGGGIERLEPILLLLLLFVVGLAALAKRLQVPYPIDAVLGGLLLSFIPRVPRIELSSNVVFLLILPPLVFSAATLTSWRDFRYNLGFISMLALGLVAFLVWGCGGEAFRDWFRGSHGIWGWCWAQSCVLRTPSPQRQSRGGSVSREEQCPGGREPRQRCDRTACSARESADWPRAEFGNERLERLSFLVATRNRDQAYC